MRRELISSCVVLLVAALPSLYGQDSQDQGWRRVDQPQAQNTPEAQNTSAPDTVPLELTIPVGTLVTVRLNQVLSSDVNEPGDAFSATLVQPIVVNGIVVARRGQTAAGSVVDARRAGRVSGTSRLGVGLSQVTLVDGSQVPIQTQFIQWRGPTSTGRDAGAVVGTSALGAVIGGVAEGGMGAGIGAAAGAAAGGIGVLLTRGRPTVLYPESVLTFRTEYPLTIATDRAPMAFQYVTQDDFAQPYEPELRARAPRYNYGYPPDYYYQAGVYPYPYFGYPAYPWYPYPYFWGPGFYGPSFGFFFGGHGGHYYHGGGGGHFHRH